jgi:hypothetical protein
MEAFPIAPAASRALWFVTGLLGLVLVLVLVFVGWSVVGARTSRFEVSRDGLRLSGDWYGRTVPIEQLRIGEARRVDLGSEPSLAPRTRTMGTGMPGYQAGWFRLRNGERALLYLTDPRRAVYVPTTAGYSLLLSPADPDAFLSALRAVAR